MIGIILPSGRFSELHYILRSIGRDAVAEYRLRGRHLYLSFFSSPLKILQSTLAVVRYHSLHPPPVSPDFPGPVLASQSGRQKRVQSPVLTQNFSTYSHGFWNSPPGPFFMYRMTPFSAGPISGTQYTNLDERAVARLPFHVIEGGGITGPNFEDLLLGNHDEEQFTAVMLTYQRNDVLIEALQRLKDVSFLNKVIVVWNNEQDPPPELQWPDINAPVEVSTEDGVSCSLLTSQCPSPSLHTAILPSCIYSLPPSPPPSPPPFSPPPTIRWCEAKETVSTIVSCHLVR